MNSRYFNWTITALFFVVVGVYLTNNQDALTELLSVPVGALIALALAKGLRILTVGLFTKITLEAFGKKITVSETNYLSILTAIGNFFGPLLGGASIRAIYLKTKHGFQYSKFVSTMYGYYLITFTVYSAIGLLALLLIYSNYGAIDGVKATALLLTSVLAAGILAISLPAKYGLKIADIKLISFVGKHIKAAVNGWSTIKSHNRMIWRLGILSLAVLLLVTIESFILYKLFVTDVNLESVILYTVLGIFPLFISITPGAIGIKEAIYLLLSSVLLIDNTQVIQMAAIDRSVTFILLLIMFFLTKTKYFSPNKEDTKNKSKS